jgi:hypothetical protein
LRFLRTKSRDKYRASLLKYSTTFPPLYCTNNNKKPEHLFWHPFHYHCPQLWP